MLRLSKLTDYGTVILAYMARKPDTTYTANGIAAQTHLTLPTVSKLLKLLTKGKLLESRRGSHGGYSLARLPSDINAVEIIDAIEGPFGITECSSNNGQCGLEPFCASGHNWQRVNLAIRGALQSLTLAQLAKPLAAAPKIEIGDRLNNPLGNQ
ncbi:MAG: SUF system Fe-S cluster assembly regulator [Gammaproteobacteria bacterium]|nr:SUF system Fe-S cluster assembly regulator [Gammaproteobacteria bacterium]